MMAFRSLISAMAVLLLLAGPSPVLAADTQASRTMVQTAIDDGLARFAGKALSLADRTSQLDGLLRRYTDPTMLSASILGRYWGKITPAEQRDFSETFMRYLVSSYAGMLRTLQSGVRVEMGDAVDLGERVRVSTVVRMPSDPAVPVPVDWDVASTPGGGLAIMDVSAEGVSIIRAMREDFASVLRRSGGKLDPLMDALRGKIAANDQDNATEK